MNLFDVLFLDVVLILFPLLICIIYLYADKNISKITKGAVLDLAILSSFFLTYKYGNSEYYTINFLVLSIIVLISYIKNHYVIANVVSFILILLYYKYFNIIVFVPYLLLIILYLLKLRKKISDFIFIDIFIFIQFFFFLIASKDGFNLSTLFLFFVAYLVIHIIYLLFKNCEHIVKYHMDYKELQQEKQIRLSLFKITHEIKNPIAVCKGYLDMMDVNNEKQVRKYIPIIKGEIERLLSLLQDFMLVNKENIDFDIMDINLLLEEILYTLKPMLDEKQIKLCCNLIDDEVYINGDYKRLSQVFINLIKNSIEAIPDDKKGIIKVKNGIYNNKLNIFIEDNGTGINEKTMKRMKEPFYTTKGRGTGLGVSLSDEIIKAHGGMLNYYSKEGIKTKTIVELPLFKETR